MGSTPYNIMMITLQVGEKYVQQHEPQGCRKQKKYEKIFCNLS